MTKFADWIERQLSFMDLLKNIQYIYGLIENIYIRRFIDMYMDLLKIYIFINLLNDEVCRLDRKAAVIRSGIC